MNNLVSFAICDKMKVIYHLALVLAVVSVCQGAALNKDVADEDLRAAITAGVRRVMQANADVQKMPADSRIQLESAISRELFNRLMMRLRQLDAAIEGSEAIARDFMISALKTIALRTRQPAESIQYAVQLVQRDYQGKMFQLLRSVGLIQPRGSQASPFISALDLETIINDILQTLLQDSSFLALIEWLSTLPVAIHNIADQLFTNKTFGEIFDMLGGRNVQSEAIAPPPEDGNDVWVAGSPNFGKVYDLIEGSLLEASPLVEKILNGYRQMSMNRAEELAEILSESREAAFLTQQQLEQVMNTSLKFLFLN